MSELESVRKYLESHGQSYLEFLTVLRTSCDEVAKELGGQVALRVYDRRDKQGGEGLKDPVKVLHACAKPVKTASLKKVADIVGVTVVVQYPDQIGLFLDRLKDRLSSRNAVEDKRKDHCGAYFATHATYRSTAIAHGGVLGEVQCKTVLHDAWSAKMHDLTYKPLGSMDPRMKDIIEAISQTLQGLEQQSQIVRDMVVSRQRGEQKPFRAALAAFLAGVEGVLLASREDTGEPEGIADLREAVKLFAQACRRESASEEAAGLNALILAALEADATAGSAWLIAVRFASVLPVREAHRFLRNAADMLFDRLAALRDVDLVTEAQMRAIPIGFYALQDFERALEYTDRMLATAESLKLSGEGVGILEFNKATWLLERESLRPSKPAVAASVGEEVEALLAAAKSKLPLTDDEGYKDTEGLRLIVYGTTKEDVRRGIRMCIEAGEPIEGDELESAVAIAYAEWRNHVGWRRYFEMAEEEVEADGG